MDLPRCLVFFDRYNAEGTNPVRYYYTSTPIVVMTQIYTVEIHHQGTVHTIQVPEDQTVLSVADQAKLGLPSSCHAGVCTTCAAQVVEGQVEQVDCMGISPDLQKQGYALLCVSYPRSNLKVDTEKEDTVYNLQLGKS